MALLACRRTLLTVLLTAAATPAATARPPDDPLARARNLGRAHYQNEHFAKAAEYFREAVELAPESAVDRLNLAVAEAQAREDLRAKETLLAARALDPPHPHLHYLLGLAHLRLGEYAEAREAYQDLLERDPLCVPAYYSLGLALDRLGETEAAIAAWERVVSLDPDHGPSYYQLFRAYDRSGQKEKAQLAFEEFNRIRETDLGPGMSRSKVERSRYFELIEEEIVAEPSQASPSRIPVTLAEVSSALGLGEVEASSDGRRALDLADLDDDGDLDLLAGSTILVNRGDRFEFAFDLGEDEPRAVSVGDLDNDGALDVAAAGSALRLLRGDGQGAFDPLTESDLVARPGPDGSGRVVDVRFVDVDHEGDLDVLVALERGLRLYRNNGNATFSDISDTSGLSAIGDATVALVLSDLECDHDIDIFLADANGRHALLVNERDGTFVDAVQPAGLTSVGPVSDAVAGDVNNDGTPDLVFFAGDEGPVQVWCNQGGTRFYRDVSSPVLAERTRDAGIEHGCLVDLDNDGDLDLLGAGESFRAFRNDGAGGWADWTEALEADELTALAALAVGDLDADGDRDLVALTRDGRLRVARNQGGDANHHVRIRLTGTKNSLDGYGSKVWTRHGRFFQVRETFERWIELGVGDRSTVQVVGLRWPTGITQNLVDVDVEEEVTITERPGFSESCPFVYAYDGERFRFVTDVLDVAPLGVSLSPGVAFWPNHREAVLIEGTRLVAENGLLSIRFTQELQEITYLDRLRLLTVDHPQEIAVVPNDRFSTAPFAAARIHRVERPHPPHTARDDEGRDLRSLLARPDRRYADDCEPLSRRYPGITRDHALILEPDPRLPKDALMLFLRGTTLWTEASVNVAVSQNPDVDVRPVSLEVIGPTGDWVEVRADVGLPAGIDKFLPVDLRGVLSGNDRRVRIATNMAVLWDQAFFGIVREPGPEEDGVPSREDVVTLDPLYADLRARGFSAVVSPDGKLPDLFDYETLVSDPPFTVVHRGSYTRYGDVVELLAAADDRFVVMAPGDEIAVDFPAITLPEVPEGWKRDYVLEAVGWIKDGDLRTRTGDTVAPLPFHAMSDYPYEGEAPGEAHREYLASYQTRWLPRRAPSPRYP